MNQFDKNLVSLWGRDLIEKYPLVFLEPDPYNVPWSVQGGVAEADYCNLRYGFECLSGWKEQIENIAKTGTEIVKHLRGIGVKDEDAYIHSCIVKEKFGTLAWQGQHKLPPLFQELWYSYYGHQEAQSGFTCEVTGKHGCRRLTKNGKPAWNRTLCTEEAVKQGYDLQDWEKEKLDALYEQHQKQKPETD